MTAMSDQRVMNVFQCGALNRGPFKDFYILAALSNTCL